MTSKRERDLQRARETRQQEKAAQDRQRRLAMGGGIAAIVIVAAAAIGIAVAANSDDAGSNNASAGSSNASASSSCSEPGTLQTKAQQFPDGPTIDQLNDSTYGLKLETNCGEIEIELDAVNAPKNSANLIFLANTGATMCDPPGASCDGPTPEGTIREVQGYFDNTTCHRLTTTGIFVLQCGDPTGTGSGNPGYTVVDEGLERTAKEFADDSGSVVYPRGTMAMANAGPNTAGSQFFLVYKDSPLAPNYTVVGKITSGLEIIDAIAEGGSTPESDGTPNDPLELIKVNSFERVTVD